MGIILMLLSSASFATMSAMIKGIGPGIPLTQLVFLRCILAVPLLLAWILLQKKPLFVTARKAILLRTLLGMTAMHGFFYALTHMPLADCTFIGRTNPLLLALFAPLILGETTPRAAWFAIFTGVIGVALIMKPAMAWPLAAWVALGASASSAGAHLMVRRLNRTDQPLIIVFNFTLLTGLLTAAPALPGFVSMSSRQWLLIAGVALFASLGQMFMTSAYGKDRAPAVAAASYSSIILSVIYGYLFWNEIPQPLAWLGGGLIIIGGLLLLKSRYNISEPASG
ncbi:DMT family transporter [Thermodesulfobacteriota bacterium]